VYREVHLLPSLEGYAVTSAYRRAQQGGGDFFQLIKQEGGSALLILGDVSGKGLPAGLKGLLWGWRHECWVPFDSTNTSSWTSNYVANETPSCIVALVTIESTGTRPPHCLLALRLIATNDKLLTIP
jgi:hypothetical protein